MRIKLTGSERRPLVLNEEMLTGWHAIMLSKRDIDLRDLAQELDLPYSRLKRLSENKFDPRRPEHPRDASNEEFEKYMEDARKWDEERTILRSLERRSNVTLNASYKNGFSFSTESFESFKETLEREPGELERFSLQAGDYSEGVQLRIWHYNGWVTGSYEVEGDRAVCENVSQSIQRLWRSCEPENRWLHNRIFTGVTAILLVSVSGYVILRKYVEYFSPENIVHRTWPQIISLNLLNGALFWLALNFLEKAYPKLQVEFGPYWRQMQARRRVLMGLITLLVLPLILAWIS